MYTYFFVFSVCTFYAFLHESTLFSFFCFALFFFCTSLISFSNFFSFLLFFLYCQKYCNHTKFLHLNSIDSSVYIGMRFYLYIFFTMFCIHSFFFHCAYLISNLSKSDKRVGWLDDRQVFRQSYMTQPPSLFTLISYCAIVFSFSLIFANGWFTSCDGFYYVYMVSFALLVTMYG